MAIRKAGKRASAGYCRGMFGGKAIICPKNGLDIVAKEYGNEEYGKEKSWKTPVSSCKYYESIGEGGWNTASQKQCKWADYWMSHFPPEKYKPDEDFSQEYK